MSLYTASLNSGSNGNCYYVGNGKEAVLVDAGISCREIERRMKRLGLAIENVKALFVSHEHSDHIRGIPSLLKKYRLPVYITAPTLKSGGLYMDKTLLRTFSHEEPVMIGDLKVTAFPKFHDAADPYSFLVECRMVKVGVFTDIGTPCNQLIHHFTQCHAAFLEANYDEGMLENGNYPYFLKKRIRGGQGHLSNRQALELFLQFRSPFLTHLFLAHLSNNNNKPELVEELFLPHAGNTRIVVASRHQESEVYQISHHLSTIDIPRFAEPVSQLALAF